MAADYRNKSLFTLNVTVMGAMVLSLPIFGVLFCVIWSLIYDFESSTATHCRVRNYLPSISAAIGGYSPQRYVWRMCIALHCTPRLMVAVCYSNYHMQVHVGKNNHIYRVLARLCTVLHILENLSLLGLTCISSNESHDKHEQLFILFMIFSLAYMLLTCYVFYWGRTANGQNMKPLEIKSFNWKVGLFLSKITCLAVAAYMFYRHNKYCEPGVYSQFALCEYLVVVVNVLFHGTALFDFKTASVVVFDFSEHKSHVHDLLV